MIKIVKKITVTGYVFSGLGKGRFFTEIDWVKDGVRKLMGFEPKPGTFNLKVRSEDFEPINEMRNFGIPLESPTPDFCNALLLPASVGKIEACAIFPEKEVWVHGDTLEILSPVTLRDELKLEDGDPVEVEVRCEISPELFIFDADGTLVDSVDFYFHLAKIYTEPFGIYLKEEDLRVAMNLGQGKIEEILLPPDLKDKKRIVEQIKSKDREIFRKLYAERCRLFDGVSEVLSFLKSQNLKLALLTTTWDIDVVLEVFRKGGCDPETIFDSIKIVEEGVDKKAGIKDKLGEIIHELGVPKTRTVYVADGVMNIECARELGIPAIAVLSGVGKAEEFEKLRADLILKSVRHLINMNRE